MLLALDTSGPSCSAALFNGQIIVAKRSDDIGRGHAEHLMPMLTDMIAEQGLSWKDFDKISCITGPGSFTGLRVGIATARGLALALSCPCQGVNVFEAFAYEAVSPISVVIDAKRDQFWMQNFTETGAGAGSSKPFVCEASEAACSIPEPISHLIGSAAAQLAEQNERFVVASNQATPPIENVAKIAFAQARGERPSPLYLRDADAKPQAATPILKVGLAT